MGDFIEETLADVRTSKLYPKRAAIKTTKSQIDIDLNNAEKELKKSKGILFFGKVAKGDYKVIQIPNVKDQNFSYQAASHPKSTVKISSKVDAQDTV